MTTTQHQTGCTRHHDAGETCTSRVIELPGTGTSAWLTLDPDTGPMAVLDARPDTTAPAGTAREFLVAVVGLIDLIAHTRT
jgi:hypothetical protein